MSRVGTRAGFTAELRLVVPGGGKRPHCYARVPRFDRDAP